MYHHLLVFTVGRILQACKNVFFCEVGEIREDLLVRHARGKVLKNIIDGDAHTPDAGLSASLAGFYGDDLSVLFHRADSTTPPIKCLSVAPAAKNRRGVPGFRVSGMLSRNAGLTHVRVPGLGMGAGATRSEPLTMKRMGSPSQGKSGSDRETRQNGFSASKGAIPLECRWWCVRLGRAPVEYLAESRAIEGRGKSVQRQRRGGPYTCTLMQRQRWGEPLCCWPYLIRPFNWRRNGS